MTLCRSLTAISLLISCIIQHGRGAVYCPPYSNHFEWVGQYCLRFENFYKKSWYDAKRECEAKGTHLLVLETTGKRDEIIRYSEKKGNWEYYWVDGTKVNSKWIWSSTRKPLSTALWMPEEPNGDGSCMQYYSDYNDRQKGPKGLNDRSCSLAYEFICEDDSVNGMWGAWGSWSSCSATCGSGQRYRARVCDNPAPKGAGAPCSGLDRQTEHCHHGACPVDGTWSVWTHWSTCSKTCGQGNRTRHRACNSPPPTNGGKDCPGQLVEVETCKGQPCPAKLCPDMFTEVTNSLCLYISDPRTESYNYFLSMKACSSLSPLSRLMTVKNAYEYHNMVRFLSTAAEYWIGDDIARSSNASPKLGGGSFALWAAGYPSSRSLANCVDLSRKSGAFLWQDAPCWERKPFICELRPKDGMAPVVG